MLFRFLHLLHYVFEKPQSLAPKFWKSLAKWFLMLSPFSSTSAIYNISVITLLYLKRIDSLFSTKWVNEKLSKKLEVAHAYRNKFSRPWSAGIDGRQYIKSRHWNKSRGDPRLRTGGEAEENWKRNVNVSEVICLGASKQTVLSSPRLAFTTAHGKGTSAREGGKERKRFAQAHFRAARRRCC